MTTASWIVAVLFPLAVLVYALVSPPPSGWSVVDLLLLLAKAISVGVVAGLVLTELMDAAARWRRRRSRRGEGGAAGPRRR